ncbi:MAG: hypothetical protein NZ918_03315 [Aigarchaeota archaeon]|nr:hypothetical protein [Aigarchaeota archaeon]
MVLGRKGLGWKALLLALVLHDSGKLSKDYTSKDRPKIHHNEASAQMAYDVLGKLQERGCIGAEEKKIISCTCFLHMEYYEWRSMLKAGYATLDQATTPGAEVEFADDVEKPLENLKLVLMDVGELDDELSLTISEISEIRKLRLRPSTYTLNSLQRQTLLKTIALQWFILLLDNRTSSARRGVNVYWSRLIEDAAASVSGAKARTERVIEFSDYLLSRLRGKLTPMPKMRPRTSENLKV